MPMPTKKERERFQNSKKVAAATSAARAAQERGKTRTTQEKVRQLYNSAFGQAVQSAYNKATSNSSTKAKAAYDDGNGTTFLNSKPKKEIKDQQNNDKVYGRVTGVTYNKKAKKGR